MINASELRIGNFVSQLYSFGCDGTKKPEWRIWELDLLDIQEVQSRPEIYNPIPLTEEWLLRLGWKYYNGKSEGNLTMDFGCKMDVDFIKGKLLIKSHYEGEDFYRDTRIEYVHQLQNLYFALTGQELEIK